MPPPSVSMQILQTLQRMEKRIGGGGGDGGSGPGRGVTGAVVAGNMATRLLSSAVSAAPTSGGTLVAQSGLMMQAIGSDPSVVNKVMQLANALRQLRGAWDGASQSSRNYATSSSMVAGAIGLTARYVPHAVSSLTASNGLAWAGIPAGTATMAMQGAGLYGAGYASEQMFGRNFGSSALRIGGAYQMGRAGSRFITRSAVGLRRSGALGSTGASLMAGAGRLGAAGLIAAEVYNALPTGEAGTETREQVEQRGGNWADYQSLHRANTGNSLTLATNRGNAIGGYQNLERAATRAGVMNRGNSVGGMFARAWDMIRPWSVEETDRVLEAHQNPSDAGLNAARSGRGLREARNRIGSAQISLGFQNRQMDIGDLHGQVQQEAIKTGPEQDAMRYFAAELRRAVDAYRAINRGDSPPS